MSQTSSSPQPGTTEFLQTSVHAVWDYEPIRRLFELGHFGTVRSLQKEGKTSEKLKTLTVEQFLACINADLSAHNNNYSLTFCQLLGEVEKKVAVSVAA